MLTLCAADQQHPEAALALSRWEELQEVGSRQKRELRFRRRAFERARDSALVAMAMRLKPWMLARKPPAPAELARSRPADGARVRHPARGPRRLARGARA